MTQCGGARALMPLPQLIQTQLPVTSMVGGVDNPKGIYDDIEDSLVTFLVIGERRSRLSVT